jgi:hypothetical protein
MNAATSACTAVRSSSRAPAWMTSVSGSGENSDGSPNGTTVDFGHVAYPFLCENCGASTTP